MKHPVQQHGFTLIELVFVLIIVAIVGIGISSFIPLSMTHGCHFPAATSERGPIQIWWRCVTVGILTTDMARV